MRRSFAILWTALMLAGCVAASPTPTATAALPTAQASEAVRPSSAGPIELAGTWHRDESCEEIAQLFESLGLRTLGASYIAGNGFRSETIATVAADTDLCRGASSPKARTITFGQAGRWTGTLAGTQVDDGSFSIATDHGIVLAHDSGDPAGTPDITLNYEIVGAMVTFTVQAPAECSSQPCIEQVAWAKETFALGPWARG